MITDHYVAGVLSEFKRYSNVGVVAFFVDGVNFIEQIKLDVIKGKYPKRATQVRQKCQIEKHASKVAHR